MTDWNILVKTRNGTVSLLKNLTKDEAQETLKRLRTQSEEGVEMRYCLSSDIVYFEAFGPEGDKLFS